jgi:hypothetical protein
MPRRRILIGIIRISCAGGTVCLSFHLDPADYEGWAYGLKKAGYATNIRYSQILIKLIKEYNLQQYSLIAMGKMA